jgi:hypothetical protein
LRLSHRFLEAPSHEEHPLFCKKGPNDFEVNFAFLFANLELESQLIRDLPPKALGASLWAGLLDLVGDAYQCLVCQRHVALDGQVAWT